MILIDHSFRCDLCGCYRARGVTESAPEIPTKVCATCVSLAVSVLLAAPKETAPDGSPCRPPPRPEDG